MDEHGKISNKSINAQRKNTTKHNLIKIDQKPIPRNSHVQFLSYQKVSIELSTLCTTKYGSCSASHLSIVNLIFNKLPQLEALFAAGNWKIIPISKNYAYWVKIPCT